MGDCAEPDADSANSARSVARPAHWSAGRWGIPLDDVQVLSDGVILSCRLGKKVVSVPQRRMLPGTTIAHTGDRGRLILSRELALNLGLI